MTKKILSPYQLPQGRSNGLIDYHNPDTQVWLSCEPQAGCMVVQKATCYVWNDELSDYIDGRSITPAEGIEMFEEDEVLNPLNNQVLKLK